MLQLPIEIIVEMACNLDDVALGACRLASIDLAAALAHEAALRRQWHTEPLNKMAKRGDIKALAWARRRANAQGRQHFRFGRACFKAAARAGRLAALQWLYADQERHGLLTCCAATTILCGAASGDHTDVVAWMLATRSELCSVTHALDSAAMAGAVGAFNLLCQHAIGSDFVADKARKFASGKEMLSVLDRHGLLEPANMFGLIAGRLVSGAPFDIETIEWLCTSDFGNRCDWNCPKLVEALCTKLTYHKPSLDDLRRFVAAIRPLTQSRRLWSDVWCIAAMRNAMDIIEDAWALAMPHPDDAEEHALAVASAAIRAGSTDVIYWLIESGHIVVDFECAIDWARGAAMWKQWPIAHHFYVEASTAAAAPAGSRRLYKTLAEIYGHAICCGSVPVVEQFRVTGADTVGREREARAFEKGFSDISRVFDFSNYAMIAYLCASIPDVVGSVRMVGSEALANAPLEVFRLFLATARSSTYSDRLLFALVEHDRRDMIEMLLAAHPALACAKCIPRASPEVRALFGLEHDAIAQLSDGIWPDALSTEEIITAALQAEPYVRAWILCRAAEEGRRDLILDTPALMDACTPDAVCAAGIKALECQLTRQGHQSLRIGRRLIENAISRGYTPKLCADLGALFTGVQFTEHFDYEYAALTVDQPSNYELAACAASLCDASDRFVESGLETLLLGDLATGALLLGAAPLRLDDDEPDRVSTLTRILRRAIDRGLLDGIAYAAPWSSDALAQYRVAVADALASVAPRSTDTRARVQTLLDRLG
jgi:hypothetical protein